MYSLDIKGPSGLQNPGYNNQMLGHKHSSFSVFKGTGINTELCMQPQTCSPIQLAPPKGMALI